MDDLKKKRGIARNVFGLSGTVFVNTNNGGVSRSLRYESIDSITKLEHNHDSITITMEGKESKWSIERDNNWKIIISANNNIDGDTKSLIVSFNSSTSIYEIENGSAIDSIKAKNSISDFFKMMDAIIKHKHLLEIVGDDESFTKTTSLINSIFSIVKDKDKKNV